MKIHFERSCCLEAQKKEAILVQESKVHSWQEKFASEKKSHMETKEETGLNL